MQQMVLAGFKSKIFWGGIPPNPSRKGVAFGHACLFHHEKCYGQIETLNPPLRIYIGLLFMQHCKK
jgi:hypothetical protein